MVRINTTVSHETLLASKTFLWRLLKTLNLLPIVRAFLKNYIYILTKKAVHLIDTRLEK